MAVKVLIPTPLQKLTGGQSEVKLHYCTASNTETTEVDTKSRDVCWLIEELEAQYHGFKDRICDENGKVRRFINIYVNSEDIRFLQGQETRIEDEDEVSIVPAIAGG
jgi:molybdopterin synthase sulfur carrier subunit